MASLEAPDTGAEEDLALDDTDPSGATTETAPVLDRKTFFDQIAERTGAKKKDAREIGEAALALLGEALSRGETLSLAPMGKAVVMRHKDMPKGEMIMVKLRRKTAVAVEENSEPPPLQKAASDARDTASG